MCGPAIRADSRIAQCTSMADIQEAVNAWQAIAHIEQQKRRGEQDKPQQHKSLTAANWVSFDFSVSYPSC